MENFKKDILPQLPVTFEASYIMSLMDSVLQVKWLDYNVVSIGYLVEDDTARTNPLDDYDQDGGGLGQIYTSHRHSNTHAEMQEALALDSNWEPHYELEEIADNPKLRKLWIKAAASSSEFIEFCKGTAGSNADLSDSGYYYRRAERYWREYDRGGWYNQNDINNFSFTGEVKFNLWQEMRSERLLGEPDSVLLDCYDHGGQVWSVSGGGSQCQWDTSVGSGVWVPSSEESRKQLSKLANIYAFGDVDYTYGDKEWLKVSELKRYYATLDLKFTNNPEERRSPFFKTENEACEWLAQTIKDRKLKFPKSKKEREAHIRMVARPRAALKMAQAALEVYNDWLAGEVYGTVVATFQKTGSGKWELADSEECWGFYGVPRAYSALVDSFESVTAGLSKIAPGWKQNLTPYSGPLANGSDQ